MVILVRKLRKTVKAIDSYERKSDNGPKADRLESLGVRVEEGGKASILSKAPASKAAEIRQRSSFIISGH